MGAFFVVMLMLVFAPEFTIALFTLAAMLCGIGVALGLAVLCYVLCPVATVIAGVSVFVFFIWRDHRRARRARLAAKLIAAGNSAQTSKTAEWTA